MKVLFRVASFLWCPHVFNWIKFEIVWQQSKKKKNGSVHINLKLACFIQFSVRSAVLFCIVMMLLLIYHKEYVFWLFMYNFFFFVLVYELLVCTSLRDVYKRQMIIYLDHNLH